MDVNFNRLLVLAPHTDDEFGCGGTIVKMLEQGADVHYAAFSTCGQSVPEGYPADILAREVRAATCSLGIKAENVSIYDFPVRRFTEHRQNILEQMIEIRKAIEPDAVFLPAPDDVHQDHQVIASEGIRAFKFVSLFGYELPWNNLTFKQSWFVELNSRHLDRKVEALACYRSQHFRNYANPEFIRALAKVRGVQAGVQYAESFEVIRLKS